MLKLKNNHFKDEQVSQIVSWGHWFTLFNIFVVIILGSQYLMIADWPRTFMGRFYAIISAIGHFSFLTFIAYLILLFPLSFFIYSSRWQRIIATITATLGITLLLIDIDVFSHFRMHLNLSIWQLLTTQKASFLSTAFILIPFILFIEILFAIWSWKKLRSLTKRKRFAKPVVLIFILCFISSHLIHIWADANFYRPITMQRSSLPLSYPLTARHFLERYGFIEQNDYRNRVIQEGNPFALAIEYPLGRITFDTEQQMKNVVMIAIDGWNYDLLDDTMPALNKFAHNSLFFTNHYGASNQSYLNDFSLFYGLDPNYYNSILASHKTSALIDAVIKQHYNLGLFSADGFAEPLYRYALLSNFTLPEPKKQTNRQVTDNWMAWHDKQNELDNHAPLFSVIQYSLGSKNKNVPITELKTEAKKLDQYLESIISYLKLSNSFDNTIIVITGSNDIKINENLKIALRDNTKSFSRESLKVPLIISWPNKEAKQISDVTTQTDILSTLMQEAFNVTTPPQQYSQGKNLFDQKSRQWIIAGNESEIAALYSDKTVVLDEFGRSKIYDLNDKLEKDQKISLPIFLQIVTENRRFMVFDD
ncbi:MULTISPECIES: DUF3413 domain-containing protein [unclassified Gilliamella]|uniref:DUF3413 domain-containing protein n=1 Tax=unclassified Gilliamella TaxID=2685620 RepID=UPI002269C0DE|nr:MULTISPECIES: DUF3413 domain-containing protein [unclassified Gilliamella]MCX8641878.1 DUF3413 domain-containing protein [Gilliamella sp. B3835]MCX8706678.1 DUF3413 domain-containing protein [Gilliamella sp. B3783]MCX8708853.1 DUF3413 domain-containing protein [Gilliamella sp. B3780]MCX8713193.1 DUF3413 domain-containing protein [Gilliamella sp. B3468]MCX8713637.1 DUF3413 domain-containing protein [Gilliamella sp. B3781]